MIPATSLPDCPQCGTTIRQAERIGVSAAVEPCGHFIPADFFRPSTVEAGVQQELVADGGRRKTEFWGYEQHHRSVRDVVDEDRWHDEEQWAIGEALGYARVISVPSSPLGACHLLQQPFIGHFEAMLDGFLHKPLDICTATKKTQKTEQTTLCDGGQSEGRHCTTCGKSLDGAAYQSWLFHTCRSCAAEPAPGRWNAGMAPGTAVKWAYTPRWHIDEHPESNHHIVADGGVERCELHLDPDRGLWVPPELREFTRQIIFRTPRATIQHFGSQPLDPYYGMIDASHFGGADEFRDAKNPELAPDRVSIKPQGEDAVEFDLRSLDSESDQGGESA